MSDRQSINAARLENLEGRTMLAVNPVVLQNGNLFIRGTDREDQIEVSIDAENPAQLNVDVIGKPTKSYAIVDISRIVIDGRGGDDSIDVHKTLTIPALLRGGFGDDFISGGGGRNNMYGEKGNDVLIGGEDRDYLDGGIGKDVLRGEGENDTLFGGAGKDSLEGSAGEDVLLGGTGKDSINGGEGEDQLFGNRGADVFLDAEDDDLRDFTRTRRLIDKFGQKIVRRGDSMA